MIDIRKLKELVRLMVENDLSELDLRDQEEKVTIRRDHGVPIVQHAPAMVAAPAGVEHQPAAAAPAASPPGGPPTNPATDGLVAIESPMVGTFYSAANPDSEPFVKTGAGVDQETVVCLVEAMKVFNEIKAETSGTIERVLVQNGEAIEFGQPLFMVRPA